jgi:uncharacterized protein with von Willebrand factor type A (vWA) domain
VAEARSGCAPADERGGLASLGGALVSNWVRFARELRAEGIRVPPSAAADAIRALEVLPLHLRADVKAAARALFVMRRDDRELFDRVFERFFAASSDAHAAPPLDAAQTDSPPPRSAPGWARGDPARPTSEPRAPREGGRDVARGQSYSAREDLRTKDFARWTAEERASLARLLARLRFRSETRPSARTRAQPRGRRGVRIDLPRVLRERLRHGELALHWRARRRRPRPLIALCDVSGSMAAYARALLLLAYALRARQNRLEAFVFATRLTRITAALRLRDPDRMLARVAELARDFSGGTRIGAALHELNDRWLRRLGGARAVVLVLSDGLDRGDPAVLEGEIARLARGCQRLLWLSPLLGVPGYRPQTRAVQALLPRVDAFLPAHNLESLERLAALLGRESERPRALRAGSRAAELRSRS